MWFKDVAFLRTTRRIRKLLPPGILLQCLVISKNAIQDGNHMINHVQQGGESNGLSSIGFLHPHRAKCVVLRKRIESMSGIDPKSENCLENPTQVDRRIYKYKEKLLKNINSLLLTLSQQYNRF